MSDILELRPRGDACKRQFRARREFYTWFTERVADVDSYDPTIEYDIGVSLLMRKPWLLYRVVCFGAFAARHLRKKPANQA